MLPLAIFYEHPDWFKPLFTALDNRGIPYVKLNAVNHQFDLSNDSIEYSLFFNRMSPSAYLRDGSQGIFYALGLLKHLEDKGVKTINGFKAYTYEASKVQQLSLIRKLKYGFPLSKAVNHVSKLIDASKSLRFPIVVKANIGGSGAGIVKYNSLQDLKNDINQQNIDLGIDHTALVQEYIPARGGYITRVETLGGKFLYAIKVYTSGDSFNLCPADICQTTDGKELLRNACAIDAPKNGLKVEAYLPPAEIIQVVENIVQEAGIDVGGIEYIIDDRDGQILYYDINALSNFVADAQNVIGFNPHERLVDFLEEKMHTNTNAIFS